MNQFKRLFGGEARFPYGEKKDVDNSIVTGLAFIKPASRNSQANYLYSESRISWKVQYTYFKNVDSHPRNLWSIHNVYE